MRRAARFDGFFPINHTWDLDRLLQPSQLQEMVDAMRTLRGGLESFEVVNAGVTPCDCEQASEMVGPYSRAGATWWLEIIEPRRGDLQRLRERVDAGPPRVVGM